MAQHPGPPTRLHDAFHVIVDAVRQGLPPKTACALGDVSRQTFYRWMRYGSEERDLQEAEEQAAPGEVVPKTYEDGSLRQSIYGDFYVQVLKARAEVAQVAVSNILEAGKEPRNWPANAWFLERTHPEEFAQTSRLEVTGRGGGPLQQEVVSGDRLEEMARRVLEQAVLRKKRALLSAGQDSVEPAAGGGTRA